MPDRPPVRRLAQRLRPVAPLPWRKPRHELLLLALVAVATLPAVYPVGSPDVSRFCLTEAIVAGRLSNDACLAGNFDKARYGGHLYSDKAPGLSVLAIPAAEATRLPPPARWDRAGDLRIWALRVSTVGLSFLLLAWLLGRAAEGLVAGAGAPVLVSAALGTLLAPLAVASFAHVPAALLGFAAFLLAWRRLPLLAGLAAGIGVCVEYQVGLVVVALAAYLALVGRRAATRYVAGLLPGGVLLAAYDWAAFGSPFRLSYRYVDNPYAGDQSSGFFGIGPPRPHAVLSTLAGDRGLLPSSPVLVAAAVGLLLLWRRGYRAEAALAAFLAIAFLALEFGYFTPYGGDSPGPRFLVPAIPFAALGLAPALAAARRAATALAALSVVSMTAIALTWPAAVNSASAGYRETVWGELARVATDGGSARILDWPGKSLLTWAGLGRLDAAAISAAAALAALAVALRPGRAERAPALETTAAP